jgi:hypothetical protein
VAQQVEIINHALRGIPEERVRYHGFRAHVGDGRGVGGRRGPHMRALDTFLRFVVTCWRDERIALRTQRAND